MSFFGARVIYNSNGQKGHDAAFTGLGKVIRRFALPREMALEAIIGWNSRCEPPWSNAELSHKLDDIYTDGATATDWGKFLTDDTDGGDRDPGSNKGSSSHNHPYLIHNSRLCIYKIEEDEEGKACSVPFPLCNFDARIISAMHCTLGDNTTIEYKIRASMWTLSGSSQVKEITIPGVIAPVTGIMRLFWAFSPSTPPESPSQEDSSLANMLDTLEARCRSDGPPAGPRSIDPLPGSRSFLTVSAVA